MQLRIPWPSRDAEHPFQLPLRRSMPLSTRGPGIRPAWEKRSTRFSRRAGCSPRARALGRRHSYEVTPPQPGGAGLRRGRHAGRSRSGGGRAAPATRPFAGVSGSLRVASARAGCTAPPYGGADVDEGPGQLDHEPLLRASDHGALVVRPSNKVPTRAQGLRDRREPSPATR